jgi:XisH protein
MAARDAFHNAVKQGLIKDGWTITHDPFVIRLGKRNMLIDLAAENLLAARREDQNIAVEIKSFTGPSDVEEFHSALGQFLNYRVALQDKRPEYKLFLAIPLETYQDFFKNCCHEKLLRLTRLALSFMTQQRR